MMPSLFASWLAITFLFYSLLSFTSSASNGLIINSSRPEVTTAHRGVVTADDGRCSRIGRDVLREGGHAVDASVAVALCLGVVSPASSGIGGGAFMLLRLANGTTEAFDMRETAPMKASKNMYSRNAALKTSGALSIAVPGELAGLHHVWEQYGKLPWKRLVNPAEKLARKGFKISPYLHMQMVKTEKGIMTDEGLRNIFTSKGALLQPGHICRNRNLAKTLLEISKNGLETFYNGSIGLNLVRDVQNAGGILTMEDLQHYQVKHREPISADIVGLKILGMPPPSSGAAAMILVLNILTQYGFPSGVSGSLGVHREIEALKHAFALKMNLGDPDFVNIKKVLYDMLSPKFAAKLKKTIFDNMTFGPSHYGGRWNPIQDHGTSHISIVDSERNAVSMTTTINSYFGAQFLSPSTGILLNNEMDDFSIPANSSAGNSPPAPANSVHPFKRPLSSMAPTIILKGAQLKAVMGASGGSMIIGGTTEVFLNYFARRMDPLSSVMAPRYYHELIPNVLYYENWTTVIGDHFEAPANIRAALKKKGHILQSLAGGTICQFVVQELKASSKFGELVAVSDPRKGGFPAGF
ncbi:Glutathione hydrolase 1 [Camellia lanceoleosa]|uniref:Glutathione hydrolase 1 n=1 Tax=Camellia lanceoleosa TaxID=1840588 RepID=A0ACC0J129_9ERIC|nr:Glutathione hydrolase 1 [Camellia lanceoleosa]